MGRSGSSSQANQATSTSSRDERIVNESGIVAKDSMLDFSSYLTNSTTDNSVTQLSNYDARNMSTSTSNAFTDTRDMSTQLSNYDSRNMSTSNYDSRNMSTTDSSNRVTGSYNTSVDPAIAKAAFDFGTENNAVLGQGLDRMLGFAKELSVKSSDNATSLAGRFQDGLAQAFDSGKNTTPGGIDNKTMIVLGVAAVAGLAFMAKKGN